MRLFFILVLTTLVGCQDSGSPEPENKPEPEEKSEPANDAGPEWLNATPAMITDEGIIVYWEADESVELPGRGTVDRWWTETQQCVSAESDPPIMRIVESWADTCHGDKPVRGLRAKYCPGEPSYMATLPMHADIRQRWKHEFMHHIFAENGDTERYDHEPHQLWFNCEWN